jgi:hypothetical protein
MDFDENVATDSSGSSALLDVPPSATSTHSSTSTAGTHLTWTGSIASVDVDNTTGRMWRMVEIVRGRCLQGMQQ